MADGHDPVKHIWYANGEQSICFDKVMIPDNPFRFDDSEGEPCIDCERKLMAWLRWWTSENDPRVMRKDMRGEKR